ncbi:MAG TPA: hypothetical protein PKX94_07415, partial [Opitutales bacterium]|nr:hypothetical protein [Opitutales bacterium]
MRFATKDHIEHDGEMDWEERRLTGDGSPYLVGGFAASVGKEWKRAFGGNATKRAWKKRARAGMLPQLWDPLSGDKRLLTQSA